MSNTSRPAPTVHPVRNGEIRQVADRAADRLVTGEVCLDFAGVDYIGSRELGSLVVLNRKLKAAGGRLALVNVGKDVAGLLNVTRLDTILDVRRAVGH